MMMLSLFRTEVKLISCAVFGPVSLSQAPNRVFIAEDGWSPVGVVTQYGGSWIMLKRRRWFWQAPPKKAATHKQMSAEFAASLRE